MKTQKGNVAVISLIVIVAVTGISIVGWMFAKKLQAPVVQTQPVTKSVESVTQSITLTTPVDETADWRTYTNTRLGFSFEYPKSWSCESLKDEQGNEVGVGCADRARSKKFDDTSNKVGGMNYFKNDLDVEFSGYKTIDEYLNDPTTENVRGTVLGGKNAHEIIIGGYGANYGIVTEFSGKVLVLSFLADSKGAIGDTEKHIIATFKFLDTTKDETADWKTYNDAKYEFELKYP